MMMLLNWVILLVMMLLSMAFFTLLERKILGYSQLRKGPNKVSFMGILQPVIDAVKLFSKEKFMPIKSNYLLFNVSSMSFLIFAFNLWILFPLDSNILMNAGILFFLCLSSLNVYSILFSSWSSNSKFALIGTLRNISQMVSYEISMFLIFINVLMFMKKLNLYLMFKDNWILIILLFNMVFLMWMLTSLAELGRAPFDFNEGESELVSGFNTEYGGNLFAFIFMAEYMNIIFIALLTSLFFFPSMFTISILFEKIMIIFKTLMICIIILLSRSSYPRFRYDMLMNLTWKVFLPINIMTLTIFLMLQ